MFVLKVASIEFIQVALEAGKKANFEGAVLLLARGLSDAHQRELTRSWSDLDDLTHKDILVLTFGLANDTKEHYRVVDDVYVAYPSSKKNTGIIIGAKGRHVIAGDVSIAYPSSKLFANNFAQLLQVAHYVPHIHDDSHDSHGTTDIRRALGLMERQLPALFIVSSRQGAEYVIELGSNDMQISPKGFISALVRNLDELSYPYQNIKREVTKLDEQLWVLHLQIEKIHRQIWEKPMQLGQLESAVYHINQTLVDASEELKEMGQKLIGFLRGVYIEPEQVKHYQLSLVRYVFAQDNASAVTRKLPKKLRNAINCRIGYEPFETPQPGPAKIDRQWLLELELSKIEKQWARRIRLDLEISEIKDQRLALSKEVATLRKRAELQFVSAVKNTIGQFRLELRPPDDQGVSQLTQKLGSTSRIVYSRKENPKVTELAHSGKISILFLSADPSNASRLRLGEELREIQEKLQLAKLRERYELHQRMSVRPSDISQALLDIQPQVVHFSGHGTATGALCFENAVGEIHPISPDALAALFKQFAKWVGCVVLNACYTEAQANAIAEHIDYVIGMNQAISDRAAIAFAIGFYQALGAGLTIEEAYELGCIQIRIMNIPEYLIPELHNKGEKAPHQKRQ